MAFPRPYGRYVLEERIAMGGMAEIFRARTATEGFEKRVCIKRVLPHFLEDEEFVTMFRDEARMAARLQHANVVQVFDFGEVDDDNGGTLYLAMELVEGNDLRRLADASRKKGIPFTHGEVTQIGIDICRGLHHAHALTDEHGNALGIVHRDVSPHNILVSRQGEVKVTDFGIAKAAERATHTSTGIVKGKVSYMSPEQAEGKDFDHRLDQWAVGVVLWELLCGARLFRGENDATILRKVLNVDVPLPASVRADVPQELASIIMRALSGEPADRFPDLRQMELALSRFLFSGAIDPATAEVRNVFPRILDAQGAEGPRRTNVMEAAAVLPSAPSAPSAPGPLSAPGPTLALSTVVLTSAAGSPSSTDEAAAPTPQGASSSLTSSEPSQVFVSSEAMRAAPGPGSGPRPSSPLAPAVASLPTQMVDDPRDADAALAAFAEQSQSAPRASGGFGSAAQAPANPDAVTEAIDESDANAAMAEAHRRANLAGPQASGRVPRAPVETVLAEGMLLAEADRVESGAVDDDGTPATRTLVPASPSLAPAAPRPVALANDDDDDDDLALPRSRAPLFAAAGLIAAGLVGGLAIAIGGQSDTLAPPMPLPPVSVATAGEGKVDVETGDAPNAPTDTAAPDADVAETNAHLADGAAAGDDETEGANTNTNATEGTDDTDGDDGETGASGTDAEPKAAEAIASRRQPRRVPRSASAVSAPSEAPARAESTPSTNASKAKGSGQVYVDIVGGWGSVSVGRKDYGETPVTLRLSAGRHTITLESGGKKKQVPVTVTAGGKVLVREKF